VNTRLQHIQNWDQYALESNGSATTMAKQCGVSVRTLERYFLKTFNKSPRMWIAERRQNRAIELLLAGSTVKETAISLGYKNQSHFSREFKKHNGNSPSQIGLTLSRK
jgi:AraC-like DNA-binding protein